MKVLDWWEVKEPGLYWLYIPKNSINYGSAKIIEVHGDGSYSHIGLDGEFLFNEEHHSGYKYVKAEQPALPVYDQYQEGNLNHERNNGDSKFPFRVEGYWRQRELPVEHVGPGRHTAAFLDRQDAELPWPYIFQIPQYDKQEFINKLADIEDLAEESRYRGFSICRITGVNRGNCEYKYKGWKWPGGLIEYIRLGVPPSRAFYAFIMDVPQSECEWLPTYNRTEDE
jgi:hypothetical protein